MNEVVIFWFRRDLRLSDNAGLHAALLSGKPVLPVFIFDKNILSGLDEKHDRRVDFIFQAVQDLSEQLRSFNSGICIKYGTPDQIFSQLTVQFNIHAIYCNRDYEPYARKRDEQIEQLVTAQGIEFRSFKDQLIFEPGEILKADQTPYTVYTPYANNWKKKFTDKHVAAFSSVSNPNYFTQVPSNDIYSLEELGFFSTDLTYSKPEIPYSIIANYDKTRNFPALKGTSDLSVHLRFGTVSIRQLVSVALETNETWLGELIWREFFMGILYFFPRVTDQCFKPAYEGIRWRNNEEEFERWCSGTTGYPIVDAGMRELRSTGRMHNRVRMITASFLTKHLLIDWRWGEAWFASQLLDYDQAANNGNWQWAAGCGCDAAPYFRIFNPYEQTKKFDKGLEYCRKWIPDLNEVSYPPPVVDHSFARQRALDTYKHGIESGKS